MRASCPFATHHGKLVHNDLSSIVAVINAAYESNALILLPSAFAQAYGAGVSQIAAADAKHGLSFVHKDTLLNALPRFNALARQLPFAPIFSDKRNMAENCIEPEDCHYVRRSLIHQLEHPSLVIDPFTEVSFVFDRDAPHLCRHCGAALQKSYQIGRKEAWEKLPTIFGLPSWDDLRELLNEDDDGRVADNVSLQTFIVSHAGRGDDAYHALYLSLFVITWLPSSCFAANILSLVKPCLNGPQEKRYMERTLINCSFRSSRSFRW